MTMAGRIYILVSFVVDILAHQPLGYLGCFSYYCLVNEIKIYGRGQDNNNGELCRAGCKNRNKRYAGTKGYNCYCGSHILENRKRNSAECTLSCPGTREICGNKGIGDGHRISLYDTWQCITSPCKNGVTCTDINAESYICSCSFGWTGRVCTVTTKTSQNMTEDTFSRGAPHLSVTESWTTTFKTPLATSYTSVIQTAVKDTTSPSSSTQAIGRSNMSNEYSVGNYSNSVIRTSVPAIHEISDINFLSSKSGMDQQHLYVLVSVASVVVVAVLAAFLVLKRKRNKVNKDGGVVDRTVPVAANEGSIDDYIYIDLPNGQYGRDERNYEHLNISLAHSDTYSKLEMIARTKSTTANKDRIYQNTSIVLTRSQEGCGELLVDDRIYDTCI